MNTSDIKLYINFIINPERILCGVWYNDSLSCPVKGYGKGVHGFIDDFLVQYEEFPEPKPTLHITLNSLAVNAERAGANWEDCRVFCVDLDRKVEEEELVSITNDYAPDMVVESSPKKYHLYWKVQSCLGTKNWKPCWSQVQAVLAHALKGDKLMRSLAHLIRVPGFPRVTKDGVLFTPRITYLNPVITPISYHHLPTRFPNFTLLLKEVRINQEAEQKAIKADVFKQIKILELSKNDDILSPELFRAKIKVGDRNNTLYHYVYQYTRNTGCSPEQAIKYAKLVMQNFDSYYPEHEAIPTIDSAYRTAKSHLLNHKARLLKFIDTITPSSKGNKDVSIVE